MFRNIAVTVILGCSAAHWAAGASASYFTNGTVRIVSSSHQDTAWMDTPANCRRFRIEHNIMPAMEMMRKDPNYTFCMECALHVMEFLEAHPELRDEVIQRMKEGRLEFGATYNQPYESWFSGEQLVRETYYGRRWIVKNLPGCDAKVAFNPDPPARSIQMQQILARAGIPYMFISRYHEGLYRWLSPDGTGILAYTPGHYGNHHPFLNSTPERCIPAIGSKLAQQSTYYGARAIPPSFCLVNSQDFSRPVSFSPLIGAWNSLPGSHAMMTYSSIRGFFEAIDRPEAKFDTLVGERPDVWIYITGPTHHETTSFRRDAGRLLPAAETFTTFASLMKGSFADWPSRELEQAWMDAIYIDHGIGGNGGHITDEVFRRKVQGASETGRALLAKALTALAGEVATEPRLGAPVVVFNDLSWERSDMVEMALPDGIPAPARVVDAAGKDAPCQLTTLGEPDEINVAAATAGAKATASSIYSADYGAEKAIDGRWDVQDPNPETGPSAKWNTAAGVPGPHWLAIDFGQARTIHKVTIRHEGVLGAHNGETRYNTAAYQVQCADSAEGPWTDLVPPVTESVASLTTHRFTPRAVRHLRLLITKGAQTDNYGRIYEVQAFEKAAPKPRLVFLAKDVPALGYRLFYLKPGGPTGSAPADGCENDFYRLKLVPGGIASLYDKRLNREWLKTDRFLGGEVFTMNSLAPQMPDAGEAGAVVQPIMDDSFDRVAAHKPEWARIENGPVRTVYQLEQPLSNTTARQRVIVWHTLPRVDCEADLLDFNGQLWREFRVALPLAMEKPTLTYEAPMGTIEIGKDEIPTTGGHAYGGLNYFQQCRDIRPRAVQNFIDAGGNSGGLTVSTSVSAFDWIDPTTNAPGAPVVQPLLLASRRSCNGSGNWYPQTGDHHYRFSLTSHAGDWHNGRKPGVGANHPLLPVLQAAGTKGTLAPQMSFATVSADNVIVSTIKKCEDDSSVIVRAYDIEGKDSRPAVRLFKPVQAAELTNLIEEEGKPLPVKDGAVEMPVGHHAIETAKFRL